MSTPQAAVSAVNQNLQRFYDTYVRQLTKAVQDNPRGYAFNVGQVPHVARKMVLGLSTGVASKDGKAIEATCKELGIAHTYTAIRAYFAADDAARRAAKADAGVTL
jgi:hypothetical protein